MGGLRVSNEVLLVKTEVTYNTDPTPATSDAVLTKGRVNRSSEGLRMVDREAIRASLGQLQKGYGGKLERWSFECEVKGSGTAGTAPEIGQLLEACGLDETIVAVTSVTYKPESAAHESVTIYYYEGGRKLHKLTGARGNVRLRTEAGGLMIAAFEMTGHYTEPTDQTQPVPSYDSVVPKLALGMAVSLNGVTAIVAKSWEWDLGNTVAMPPSISATDGYGEIIITKRGVKGNMLIETELDSVLDVDALLSAGTRFAWASGTLGSVAGNRVAVSTPSSSTYVTDPPASDADGLALRNVQMEVDDSTPDVELSIAFT
jgi:hypothetical protein